MRGKEEMARRIIVIGGGASGMMAAIAAARRGAEVALLEKNRQLGRKLLATGNGRCNFTNRNQELEHYRCEDSGFVERALQAFSMADTVEFFEILGIPAKEQQGRLYPNSGQASSVVAALRMELERLKVKLRCNTEVRSVERKDGGFLVRTEGFAYQADAVILSCGSMAAPDTGSTKDGFCIAESLGHRITAPLPALTGLCAAQTDCGRLSGVRAEGRAKLFIDGELAAQDEGEIQFASYGLSGIPIFQVSRYASRALARGKACDVYLDLWPGHLEESIIRWLERHKAYTGERSGPDILLGTFPDRLSGVLLARTGIPLAKKKKDWTKADYRKLVAQIKGMHFTVTKCRGYEQAQVCTGGVPLAELKGISMESAKAPGLYLSGELLDVDGACGGYNLQWAWTTGYLAGSASAKEKGGSPCLGSNS